MRLNTLWNKISWRGIVDRICCICLLLAACCTSARAAEPQTLIETGAVTYTETGFAVDVTVKFEDMSLYNNQVYLSYHIVDENGKDLLFENQRILVNLEAAFTTVWVDCANLEELANRETAVIQFDLVDQKNVYWFSRKTDIAFQTASVVFDRALLRTSASPEQASGIGEMNHSTESPTGTPPAVFSVVFNLIVWVLLAVLACRFIGKNYSNLWKAGKLSEIFFQQPPVKCEKVTVVTLIKNWGSGLKYAIPVGCFSTIFLFCNNASDVSLLQGLQALVYSIGITALWLAVMMFVYRRDPKGAVLATAVGLLLFWNMAIQLKHNE